MGSRRRIFKACPCGAAYTLRQWRALKLQAVLDVERILAEAAPSTILPASEDAVAPIEMRDCAACGSTISVVVPYRGGSEYPPYARGSPMRYCRECKESKAPRENCPSCAEERHAQVAALAREIFVRGVSRKAARTAMRGTYKENALEAFIASDDFMGVAEQWADEGRDNVLARRPERSPAEPKKKPGG